MTEGKTDFRAVIGLVLRYGVIVSFTLVALGTVLLFLEGQTGYYPMGTAEQLFDSQNRFLIGLVPLIQGVASAKPYAIIDLGLVVLLATPLARVTISIFLFIDEKRYAFVAITATVLTILLLSMFVVAPLVSP
ncbi:MAG TPA: DUF1634 domain-containing protein [Nitrososphaerales archaeon]|nr:DUF1634 domain-containing protein [Nitrososphaerales archaeon]